MQLSEAQKIVDKWIKTIGVRYFNELTNMSILMEEVGEMARIASRLFGEQSFKKEEDKANASIMWEEEIADAFFVLICLANQTGVDIEQAFEKNLQKKTTRDRQRHIENDKLKMD